MTAKKMRRTPAKIAEDREKIQDLHLKGYPLRHIAKKVKLSHEQVRRELKKINEILSAPEYSDDLRLLLVKDMERLRFIFREAWEGWERSKGTQTIERIKTKDKVVAMGKGADAQLCPVTEVEETKTKKKLIGDKGFLRVMLDVVVERNRLLGTYDRTDENREDPVEAIRFEQKVYIPGVGDFSMDVLERALAEMGGNLDAWHLMEALLQHQEPHTWTGVNDPTTDN